MDSIGGTSNNFILFKELNLIRLFFCAFKLQTSLMIYRQVRRNTDKFRDLQTSQTKCRQLHRFADESDEMQTTSPICRRVRRITDKFRDLQTSELEYRQI